MEKQKVKPKTMTLTPELTEFATKESKNVFGKENFSGFISYVLNSLKNGSIKIEDKRIKKKIIKDFCKDFDVNFVESEIDGYLSDD